MSGRWWLDVRDKPGALWAICDQFAGRGEISFEGELGRFDLTSIPGSVASERGLLRRATESPKLDFVVLPLTDDTIARLKTALTGSKVFGRDGAVIHVQLQSGGRLVFAAYDNFHKDCVVAEEPISLEFLQSLAERGLLRAYVPAA
jgi:hypothetical protein